VWLVLELKHLNPEIFTVDSCIDGPKSLCPRMRQSAPLLHWMQQYYTLRHGGWQSIRPADKASILYTIPISQVYMTQWLNDLGNDAPSGVEVRHMISSPSSYCYCYPIYRCNKVYNNREYVQPRPRCPPVHHHHYTTRQCHLVLLRSRHSIFTENNLRCRTSQFILKGDDEGTIHPGVMW